MKEVQFFKNKGHVYNHDSGGSHVGSKQAFSNAYTGFNYDASISHNPAPCIKLIWYEDKTNKCIDTFTNMLHYVTTVVNLLHVHVSATLVAILWEVLYMDIGYVTKTSKTNAQL